MSEPREKPILFSGAMVKAILDGRKSMTRRVVTPQPVLSKHAGWIIPHGSQVKPDSLPDGSEPQDPPYGWGQAMWFHLCPYGTVGTRLWVRERMRVVEWHESPDCATARLGFVTVKYEADDTISKPIAYPARLATPKVGKCLAYGGPRECSRIMLENAGVKVERLQSISEEDARAEGVESFIHDGCGVYRNYSLGAGTWEMTARSSFASLWNSINADRCPWESNPWVWAISFRRIANAERPRNPAARGGGEVPSRDGEDHVRRDKPHRGRFLRAGGVPSRARRRDEAGGGAGVEVQVWPLLSLP